jgi:uncharacterized protein
MFDPFVVAVGFSLGLFSTLHCLGMCGGIVSALSCAVPKQVEQNPIKRNGYIMLYNLGRVLTYTLLGWLAGAGGGLLFEHVDPDLWHKLAAVIAGLGLLFAGVYLGGWVPAVRRVDLAGRAAWRKIEPLGRRLLPIRSPIAALVVGIIWGWLPCGLVYYALVTAAALPEPALAAVFMAAFGLGTVPGMQTAGAIGGLLIRVSRNSKARNAAAIIIACIGLLTLSLVITDAPHRFMLSFGVDTGQHHGH